MSWIRKLLGLGAPTAVEPESKPEPESPPRDSALDEARRAFRDAMDAPLLISLDNLDHAVAVMTATKARKLASKTPPPMTHREPFPSIPKDL